MMNPKFSGARTEVRPDNMIGVAMEDLPEVERRVLEKELEEEMAEARRRKLACYQKTCTGVIKKTVPAIMTMATATSMVTPNLTPEELVKFMDVAVASKYGNDKHPLVEPSTRHPGSTSAPGKMGTLYPGNTIVPGNLGNIASTNTLYPGNTSVNVI
jgi:hypothetical protein